MTLLTMIALLLFGIFSYQVLPVSDLPNVDLPTIKVNVSFPGASSKTMANSVATPLERQLMSIEGLETVFSSSNNGSTEIVLQFALERDIDAASTDVQAAITRAMTDLPDDLPSNPTYQKVNPASTPILYFVIYSSTMTEGQLYDFGDTFLGRRFSMINGVAQVLSFGSPYAVRVQVDPAQLAVKKIGIDEVASEIRAQNVDLPLGSLWGPKHNFTIASDGQLFDAAPYEEIAIKNENGSIVKIKNVGQALDSVRVDKFYRRYVTKEMTTPCIILAIQRLPGTNTVEIAKNVYATLEALRSQIPETVTILPLYDQSVSILEGDAEVKLTLIVTLFLVVLIIYIFLGRALNTIIPALALPISIFGTFAFLNAYGFSLNLLSLLAITLSMGFLVDDAIVVLENNVRHVQSGKPPRDAAIYSAQEISTTVLSMTLCLVAAFIPLLFMKGVIGRLFSEFAVTLVTVVLLSGVIALTLTPMLGSRLVRPYEKEHKTRVEAFSDRAMEKLRSLYEPCLNWSLNHRIVMLGVGVASILVSGYLFTALPVDFIPDNDVGFLQSYTLAREGTSPFQMEIYHQEVSKAMIEDPNIDSVISISSPTNPNEGIIFLKMKPYRQREPMGKVLTNLLAKVREIPGVNVYMSSIPIVNFRVGSTAKANFQYALSSMDWDSLYEYAPTLLKKLSENPKFTQVSYDLRFDQPTWGLDILRDKAAFYNLTAEEIERFLMLAYSNNRISQISADINQYDVLIETLPRYYRDPSVLSQLYVQSQTGSLVPLAEVVKTSETVSPLTVNHLNGLPEVGFSFNPAEGVTVGTLIEELKTITEKEMPPQIAGEVIGTAQVFAKSFTNINFLLFMSFFVIFVVLGILYESFIHPITVMSTLPPALLGGLSTLAIFGHSLSIYSFVGLILLVGMVLKNGIMMVDFAIVAVEKEKKSARDAIFEACMIRFRPILMTTLAAMMGAVPIASGIGGFFAKVIQPLGLCIIGGLLVSQVLTLLLTPVIYYYFEILQEKVFAKIDIFRHPEHHPNSGK
jgi:HAE1 family hydrophobic/amphiphilic exporter-1